MRVFGGRASPQAERRCCRHSNSSLLRGPCVRGEVPRSEGPDLAARMETTGGERCLEEPGFGNLVRFASSFDNMIMPQSAKWPPEYG